jgi:DNA-binding response OmpR family regulator
MTEAGAAKPRIAILEDHDDTRELLRISLERHFSCRDFNNASDLLAALGQEKFSAVVADIMLPGLDGFSFIKAVRANPRLKNLCVVAVTALAFDSDRNKGLAAGFDDYLVKPLLPDDIAEAVWRCLRAA